MSIEDMSVEDLVKELRAATGNETLQKAADILEEQAAKIKFLEAMSHDLMRGGLLGRSASQDPEGEDRAWKASMNYVKVLAERNRKRREAEKLKNPTDEDEHADQCRPERDPETQMKVDRAWAAFRH